MTNTISDMFRALAVTFVLLLVAAACSSSGSGDTSAGPSAASTITPTSIDQTSPPASSAAPTPNSGTTTLVSAVDGGVVTFGDDVTLTIPAGALDTDTEIGITAIPESDWPEEFAGLQDISVIGDYLQLSPDGLTFNEPAILSRRANDVVEVSGGEVSLSPSATLSRSTGEWQALPQKVMIDDGGTVIETPIEHFSENVLVVEHDLLSVTVTLTPRAVERSVGDSFAVRFSVEPKAGRIEPGYWIVTLANDLTVTRSLISPIEPTGPTSFRLVSSDPAEKYGSAKEGGRSQLVAPAGTLMPAQFVAGYQCVAAGNAGIVADFHFSMRSNMEIVRQLFAGYDMPLPPLNEVDEHGNPIFPPDPDVYLIEGLILNKVKCGDSPEDLTPGLFDVASDVASDPAGHTCCVKRPPRKARMTLGSLWFTDAKLGDSNQWQGLFFDSGPGSSDDVMMGVNDLTNGPPNTVKIELADDFDQTGRFTAEGVGTVAGFNNIRVRLEAVASDRGTWSGTLTKGVDGGLPTGQAIVYNISGSLIAPQPVEFVQQLAQAFRDGDSEFLLEHLHPEVLALYAGACIGFTNGISSPDLDIAVHSFNDVADWAVTLDGHELTIPNAVSLDVTRTEGGQSNRSIMHVAARPGDGPPSEMTWFADCGDPFPIG